MAGFLKIGKVWAMLVVAAASASTPHGAIPERILGKPNAPIMVEEYVSLTCPHCADFTRDILPELEKRYVETGKVKFILRDFPMDGPGLKAATLARCMPAEQYYPFIKLLYSNQMNWALAPDKEKILISYAKLGGLSEEKAKACLADTKLQDAIVAARVEAGEKLGIDSTPIFIINNGAERLKGARPVTEFAAIFDRLLAEKH